MFLRNIEYLGKNEPPKEMQNIQSTEDNDGKDDDEELFL